MARIPAARFPQNLSIRLPQLLRTPPAQAVRLPETEVPELYLGWGGVMGGGEF